MTNKAPSMTIDFSEIENGMNIILSLADAVKTKHVRDSVVKTLSHRATGGFLSKADLTAGASKIGISHMYEWGAAGNPKSRLFNMRWTGSSGSYTGHVNFLNASMEIPVPISRTHQAYIEEKNAKRSPEAGQIRLSRFVWLDKAYQLETKSRFEIRPQGNAVERDGWIRTRPGNPGPARALMVEVNGDIKFFKKFTNKYEYAGKFTGFFNDFWTEKNFEQAEFRRFQRSYHSVVYRLFSTEIARAKVSVPARIQSPGIHLVSNGRRSLERATGRVMPGLVSKYEKAIIREVVSNA